MELDKIFGMDDSQHYGNFLEASWLRKSDARIEKMSDEDLKKKIELIISGGYFYNPYINQFHNHFNNRTLKGIIVYNMSFDQINDLLIGYDTGVSFNNLEDVNSKIFNEGKFWRFYMDIDTMSGIYGVLTIITSIAFYLFSNLLGATITALLSFVFLNWYILDNTTYEEYFLNDAALSPLWRKYKSLFVILPVIISPYWVYLIYLQTSKIVIPIIALLIFNYLINKLVINKKANRYWGGLYYSQIENFGKTLFKDNPTHT